jgi:hypothetical protein
VKQQRLSTQMMGYLGQGGLHPLPLTRRQNDYPDFVHHVAMQITSLGL